MKNKSIVILFVFISCVLIHITVYSKYVIETTFQVAQINVDRTRPILSVIEIINSNIGYEKYANKDQTITLKVEVDEKNIETDIIKKEDIDVIVGGSKSISREININKQEIKGDIITYQISITNITGNGELQIRFREGAIIDIAGWRSEEYIVDTNITIDNIAPQATFSESMLPFDESQGTLVINEKVRPIKEWNIDDTQQIFKQIFRKNGTYIYTIVDYAGNESRVIVIVKKADSASIII